MSAPAVSAGFRHSGLWGAEPIEDGARFRLWAPAQSEIFLGLAKTGETLPMVPQSDGWFELITDRVAAGDAYSFVLPSGMSVPDPAARAQRGDVHGPSRLVDPEAYCWRHPDWRGRPWEEAVFYELHTGTFSPEGDFEGVAHHFDRLAALGVTAIELLPVAQFSGDRGWGYDGVLLYAPHQAYGGPHGLKRLVDAAHERGLMILLDVVYNHFGPDGNYLHLYAPDFFDPRRQTPWGPAIAFNKRAVREFFIQNALYWLIEYQFDGLRFDAIDQIDDPSAPPILTELAFRIRETLPHRHIHLTSEDDKNSTALLQFDAQNRPALFTAEWNDDWHHAMHHLLTGETDGFYQDYVDRPAERIAKILCQGFDYQGEASAFRDGAIRGEPSGHLPPTAFIDFLQNHDQAGNRAFGERIGALVTDDVNEAALALLLLSPHIPLLFMGEEYSEQSPFFFFTDFHGPLAEAVRKGRRAEFKKVHAFSDPQAQDRIPDPNALNTFEASKLKTDEMDAAKGERRQAFIGNLLRIRHIHIVPLLAHFAPHAGTIEAQSGRAFAVTWHTKACTTDTQPAQDGHAQEKHSEERRAEESRLIIAANLDNQAAPLAPTDQSLFLQGSVLYERPDGAAKALAGGELPPWAVVCRLHTGNAGHGQSGRAESNTQHQNEHGG